MSDAGSPVRPPGRRRSATSAADVLPAVPRLASLDALLREVDGLRLTLEADLSVAAAATEAGALQVAADVVAADQAEVARFERRSLAHLRDRGPRRRVPTLLWRAAPVVPVAAAAAAVVVGLSLAPGATAPSRPTGQSSTRVSLSAYDRLAQVVQQAPGPEALRVAAAPLHAEVLALLDRAGSDPSAHRAAAEALEGERRLLLALPADARDRDVVVAWQGLSDRLAATAPPEPAPDAPAAPVAPVTATPLEAPAPASPTTPPTGHAPLDGSDAGAPPLPTAAVQGRLEVPAPTLPPTLPPAPPAR